MEEIFSFQNGVYIARTHQIPHNWQIFAKPVQLYGILYKVSEPNLDVVVRIQSDKSDVYAIAFLDQVEWLVY